MNKQEAEQMLQKQLDQYRKKSYSELVKLVNAEPVTFELPGAQGARYQFEIQAFWDSEPNADIHVIGSIDDGGWRAFSPISDSFIKSCKGESGGV